MAKKISGLVIVAILLFYFLTLVLHISANHDEYQWDFRTHRAAGKIFSSGANPYDPSILFPEAGARLRYTYPPATLFVYQLFALMEYHTAFHVFLILKSLLLVGLVFFWQKEFLGNNADPFFYIFCLLAFNSAVFIDLIAGNINLVEQVILWVAFCFYLRHRLFLFCIFTLIAASFKMTPAFFLILLLLADDRKKYQYFLGSVVAFFFYLLIQYFVMPEFFTWFIKNALSVVSERGEVSPSSYKLIGHAIRFLNDLTGIKIPSVINLVAAGVVTAGIILLTYRAYIQLERSQIKDKEMIAVFLVCLLYALIHPRLKDYMFLLLLLPSYYIIKNIRYTQIAPFLYVLMILSCNKMVLPIASSLMELIWVYYPLIIAFCVWGIYLNEIFAAAKNPLKAESGGKQSRIT